MYNPLKHKRPYGATAVGINTQIVFPLDMEEHVKRVFIVLRDKNNTTQLRFQLNKTTVDKLPNASYFKNFLSDDEDIFYCSFQMTDWGIWYYRFEGELQNGDLAFYGRGKCGDAIRGDWLPEWQLTVSKIDYKTPDWAKQGVIYHAFADRFAKVGDNPFNKMGMVHQNWYDRPCVEQPGHDYQADDFFGGNIKGIISKLDYLKSLGVSILYLSPIFKSRSNHRYDTGDYKTIDELFGSEEEFKELIDKADEHGIKIMLDGVFNHTGDDSIYFNRYGNYPSLGAYQSKESPYYDWYTFYRYPDKYYCWWGSTVVPTVNKNSKSYRNYLFGKDGVIEKWTKMGVKGWRLDVVDELPIDFTNELCKTIKANDKDALIIGEVWEDASIKVSYSTWRPYFMGYQLDGVMNYPFKTAILNYALKGDAITFKDNITRILEHYPKQSTDTLMNLIDSHDTVRALTYLSQVQAPATKAERAEYRLNPNDRARAKEKLKMVATIQYTLPGIPSLYYGDEVGMEGFEDPMNRATYPWGNEDLELLDFYKKLGKMRRNYVDEFKGELQFENEQCLCYTRRSDKGAIIVFANNSDKNFSKELYCYDVLEERKIENLQVPSHSVKVVYIEKKNQ